MKRLFSKTRLALLALVLVVAGFATSQWTATGASSNLGVVKKDELIQRVTIAGTVAPNRKTIISAPYNGYVRKIYVEVGNKVRAGDPVISLAQSLRGSSEDVFPLRAPFDGTVVQVLRTEGEYVEQGGAGGSGGGSGNSMVRIDDLTRIFVEANTPEVEVGRLKVGQEAIIKASAILSRSYKGVIRHISLAAMEQKDWDRSRVEFPVTIEVTDNDGQLEPGMSVVVDIITHKLKNVLTLNQEFVQKDGEKYFVITDKGKRKDIEVGLQNEDVFEIKAGLKEGEKIRQTDFLSVLKAQ